MARWALMVLVLTGLPALAAAQPPSAAELKEEDTGVTVEKEYAFNPLQAEKELRTGDFYAKKGSHKAAASRYLEAVKWNPTLAEGWRKLAISREKLKDEQAAIEAWKKYLELDPSAKDAKAIRKKVESKSS